MVLESAFVKLDSPNLLLVVPLEFLADPIKSELLMEVAVARLDSLTIMEFAPNAHLEPSGAPLQINASLSVVKTQLTVQKMENVSVLMDLVLWVECVKDAQETTLSAMDIVLLAQSTLNTILSQETAIVSVDSSPINSEFVLKNVEQMKNIILILINANV